MAERIEDPLAGGLSALARWRYVYDFDEDWGGFASGEFLLRSDGALFLREGYDVLSKGKTTWRLQPWIFIELIGTDVEACARTLKRQNYDLKEPSPVPVDRRRM